MGNLQTIRDIEHEVDRIVVNFIDQYSTIYDDASTRGAKKRKGF